MNQRKILYCDVPNLKDKEMMDDNEVELNNRLYGIYESIQTKNLFKIDNKTGR